MKFKKAILEKSDILTAPYTMSTTNNNKCPHGFALGSCPLCSGMGGGAPHDKNKPRKAGEMSYNECMAEWKKIQARQNAQKEAKLEAKKDFLFEMFSSKPIINVKKVIKFQNKIINKMENLPLIIKAPIKFVLKTIHNTINFVLNTINNVQTFVQNVVQNTIKFFNNIAEKLPMVLYEIKNIISMFAQKIILTPFKTVLTLFVGTNTREDDKKDKQRKKVKRILEKLFELYFKEKNDNKQDF